MKTINTNCLLLLCLLCMATSCNDEWLEEKRDISLVVPKTLRDMRLMLNNSQPLVYECKGIAELACGDLYFTDTDWQSKISLERYGYIWSDKLFDESTFVAEWDYSYSQIFIANIVLETLPNIPVDETNEEEWNDVKGAALFFRARAFFNAAQLFAKPYDYQTAASDPGIPLRLSSDIHASSVRASVSETYERILADLLEAEGLLRLKSAYKTDASKLAAYGYLARCYLSMRYYEKALHYADLFLNSKNDLIDYNTLNANASAPFALFNNEVIFHSTISSSFTGFRAPSGKIEPSLYTLYSPNDLRQKLFFVKNADGTFSFKGNYTGGSTLFGGIATNEMYLTRAECYARSGLIEHALNDLNTLLAKRYKTGTFVPVAEQDAEAALGVILIERRKELVMRGLRWTDLRRLNQESVHAATLVRTVNGETSTLLPGDSRYVFLIPNYVIQISGIHQNSR